jgi:solute carrier family 6 (neurotransmitter transporter), invertebrate
VKYYFLSCKRYSFQRIIAHHQEQRRPNSAPVVTTTATTTRSTTSSANLQRNSHRPRQSLPSSEPSSMASSRNSSPVSIVSSTGSSSVPDAEIRPRFNSQHLTSDDDEREQSENATKTSWPHLLSRSICCVFCTLGLFNISRFAIFSVHFGGKQQQRVGDTFHHRFVIVFFFFFFLFAANFLVQFLLLSFIFGIPFLWLQMVLGHKIGQGGIVTMYKITPICKGIGLALMISHCIITLYSSVSIAWVLIYLR